MNRRGATHVQLLIVCAVIVVLYGLLGGAWLTEMPVTLTLGWVRYLGRVVPQLNPDPWTVGTAVFCLSALIVGSHAFFRWLAGSEWPWARTLRCVGLVVLMFVAGIAMVGVTHQTAWLVRSPEPLTTGGVRVAAARMQSANNLKQMGLATHNYHESAKQLPSSGFNSTGQPMHSWQTALLPYIEQDAIYTRIDLRNTWTHPTNAEPLGQAIKTFRNPLADSEPWVNGFGVSHFAGNVFVVMGELKTLDDFPAGTSNTILAGEVASNFRAWGDPLNVRDPRLGVRGHPQGFGGPKGKLPHFAMLDGSVRTFDAQELAELVGKVPE